MQKGKTLLTSTTGRKILIALTGLALIAFLFTHLAGNYLVFLGPGAFNGYAHTLTSTPLVYALEIGLAALFLLHIVKAIANYGANKKARPAAYTKKEWAGGTSKKTLSSTTMIITGTITLLFLLVHLKGLKFGHMETNAHGVKDLYGLEMQYFSNPLIVGFYVLSMGVIGFHLWHGFWSALQSLGLGNSRYTPRLVLVSKIIATFIAVAFAVIPLWVYFVGSKQ